jgi:hypothetical protein
MKIFSTPSPAPAWSLRVKGSSKGKENALINLGLGIEQRTFTVGKYAGAEAQSRYTVEMSCIEIKR